MLNSAIEYTWRVGVALDGNRAAVEARTLALRLLGLAKRGEANLDLATLLSFGLYHKEYLRRTAEREQMMRAEFLALLPDYDPIEARRYEAMVKAGRKRRPEAFSGNLYEMPKEERSTQPQPLRKVPRKTA
jgi:hypothetical protein